MTDEAGHDDASDGVSPVQSDEHAQKPEQSASGRQGIEPGVFGVGYQGRGVDPDADAPLVPGDDLVSEDSDGGPCYRPADVTGATVVEKLADTFYPGECRAGPDDDGNTDP